MELRSPLDWPLNQERQHCQERADFDPNLPISAARMRLERQLRITGATNAVLSSDLQLTAARTFTTRQQPEVDQGIAIAFRLDGVDLAMGFDRWTRLAQNIQAAAKTIEALRGLDRWGSVQVQRMAFRGFAAWQANPGIRPWWEVLGVSRNASPLVVTIAWRELSAKHDPDAGGNPDRFLAIQQAYEAATVERTT